MVWIKRSIKQYTLPQTKFAGGIKSRFSHNKAKIGYFPKKAFGISPFIIRPLLFELFEHLENSGTVDSEIFART